jgi:ketose-bisphosphate aldolase
MQFGVTGSPFACVRSYMTTLRAVLERADANGTAVGHFNISDLVALKAAFEAARQLNVPVIVGASEGERRFMGVRQVAALVRSLRDEYDFPIYLNADHTHSLASGLEAATAGFDWIVFDVSTLPFEENVRQTKAAVEALKAARPDVLVEGEIGDIGSGSEIHDTAPDLPKGLTSPVEAKQFVEETRIDTLAPAVGNMHGMLKSMVAGNTKKRLDIDRIRAIKAAARIFLTLHGASGTDDDDLRKAIAAGITVIHINTEVRLAWRRGFDAALAKQPDEIVPYKILPEVVDSVKQVVAARLTLFSTAQRARSAS